MEEMKMNTDKIYAEQLANEYAPKDTSKVVALRKLDAKAKLPANIFTYTLGIISALLMGVGMCLSMNVIGSGTTGMFVLGVIIGLIGLIEWELIIQFIRKYLFVENKSMLLKLWNLLKKLVMKNNGNNI